MAARTPAVHAGPALTILSAVVWWHAARITRHPSRIAFGTPTRPARRLVERTERQPLERRGRLVRACASQSTQEHPSASSCELRNAMETCEGA